MGGGSARNMSKQFPHKINCITLLLVGYIYWNILTMHGPIKVKFKTNGTMSSSAHFRCVRQSPHTYTTLSKHIRNRF